MSEPLWQPRTDRAARLLGAGFLAGGAALIGYQVKGILDQAAAGAGQVDYFLAAFALGALGVLLGLYWIARGLAGYTRVRSLQRDSGQMRLFMGVALVVMVVLYLALQQWLATLGYTG